MTTQINLLPWREERREYEKKEFHLLMAIAFGLALIIIGGAHLYMSMMYDTQLEYNDLVRGEIVVLQQQIEEIEKLEEEKNQLLARINVVQALQKNRPEIVHLFNQVVEILPAGVHFSAITRQGKNVYFQCFASANSQISSLMREMKNNSGFKIPILNNIVSDEIKGIPMKTFDLSSNYLVISPRVHAQPLEFSPVQGGAP